MSDQTAPEPTMEEILASIRRIISEDDAPRGDGAQTAPADDEDDVLELTEAVDEAPPASSPDEVAAPPLPESPPPQAAAEPEPPAPPPVFRDEPLISRRAATVAASAFRELSAAAQPPRESRTLEDLAREMLEPMLRQWLDDNLPRIVEAAVREEVERISRSRVG
jgi:cell pole-organizing protein PopZ